MCKISKNFTVSEFERSEYATKHHIENKINTEELYYNLESLVNNILQPIRDKLGMSINITSGYRCKQLNDAIGGSKTSQHCDMTAADIHCKNMLKLWEVIIDMIKNGEIETGQLIDEFGLSWIHISSPTRGKVNEVLKATKKNRKTVYTKLKI